MAVVLETNTVSVLSRFLHRTEKKIQRQNLAVNAQFHHTTLHPEKKNNGCSFPLGTIKRRQGAFPVIPPE